ncbi:MAG: DsbA family protein [Alphaproteobacteria bacterium]|nr:DsbA family protein [Alphaproteobacteria bacterium]
MRRRTLNFAIGMFLAAPGLAAISSRSALSQTGVDLEAALAPRTIGSPDAKVVLVEYFSLTCPHCARFHAETYPKLKEKYIDTGKVRMEFRDFPLDQWALRASALARCVPEKHYAAMIDVLMKQQEAWARAPDPLEALLRIGQLAGLNRDAAKACMTDGKLLDGIIASRLDGSKNHAIESTPSFLLDGEKIRAYTFEDFEELLAGLAA